MAYDLIARIQAKWRGLLVYVLLQGMTHFVTRVIFFEAHEPQLKIYANLVSIATTLYCFIKATVLLLQDREGDDQWPPLW